MMPASRLVKAALLTFTFSVLQITAFGQGIVTGAVSGTVQDASAAVIVGANVKATQLATNTEFKGVTDSHGYFELKNLPIGTYLVTISAPNFSDLRVSQVLVESGKNNALGGMTLKVGDVTATIFQMTGHTPGSIGMVVPVRYQGRQHPILLVTAGTDVHNREAFVGGYEHIWDEAIRMKAESVMQDHPNTNMNLLARTKYVNDHYPPAKNPLLYGAARTERYINIMRNCTLARMDILGW